jgi:hypothetical protein
MDKFWKRFSEGFPVKAFKIISQVFSDFLLGGLGYFNNTGVPPLAVLGLIIGILRLNRRFRKSKIIFYLYWLGIVLSLDFICALGYAAEASYGMRPIYLMTGIYAALFLVKKIWKWPSFMTPIQLLIVPVCILGLVIKSGEIWNPVNKCSHINRVTGLKILNDPKYNFTQISHTAIPRFFVPRPERGDMLVCDHVYIYENDIFVKNAINRLDLKTGLMTPWYRRGNVLAIKEEPETKLIYAIIQKNFRDAKAPNVEFIKFSPEGTVLSRKDLHLSRNTFYGASITLLPEKIFLTVESNFLMYNKRNGSVEKFSVSGNIGTPVYRTAWADPNLFGAFSVTPLFGRFLKSRHLMKINLETRSVDTWMKDYPVGIFDVERRPGKDQLAASRNFPAGGWLLDFNLNKLKKLVVPPGVREIEFSNDGKYLYAVSFFTGMFYVIDVDKNKLVAETFVGNGSRGMAVASDGKVVVGASCGVVGVDVDIFLKGCGKK